MFIALLATSKKYLSQLEFNTENTSNRETLFANVILPVPIPRMFTYRVPFELNEHVKIGCRVIVQFGRRKILTGIIGELHNHPPEKYEAKYLFEPLDEHTIMPAHTLTIPNPFESLSMQFMF